ncbi:MAG TPA: DUF4191 domain-containing protein [Nocardioidaceae bacterium]
MARKNKPKKNGRMSQILASYRMTKQSDPKIGLILLGWFVLSAGLAFLVLSFVPGHWVLDLVSALMLGLLVALIVFGRRAQNAGYKQIEGQPGAAAAALGMLRRGWTLEPAVGFNRNQDVVHRVVGRPGIILVGEGNPNRVKALLAAERRKHERVASEVPIREVVVGDSEGAVPLPKLVRHVQKQPKALKPAEVTDLLARLRAIDAARPNIPLPKGPIPTSLKGARQNMRGR